MRFPPKGAMNVERTVEPIKELRATTLELLERVLVQGKYNEDDSQ